MLPQSPDEYRYGTQGVQIKIRRTCPFLGHHTRPFLGHHTRPFTDTIPVRSRTPYPSVPWTPKNTFSALRGLFLLSVRQTGTPRKSQYTNQSMCFLAWCLIYEGGHGFSFLRLYHRGKRLSASMAVIGRGDKPNDFLKFLKKTHLKEEREENRERGRSSGGGVQRRWSAAILLGAPTTAVARESSSGGGVGGGGVAGAVKGGLGTAQTVEAARTEWSGLESGRVRVSREESGRLRSTHPRFHLAPWWVGVPPPKSGHQGQTPLRVGRLCHPWAGLLNSPSAGEFACDLLLLFFFFVRGVEDEAIHPYIYFGDGLGLFTPEDYDFVEAGRAWLLVGG
ncbi:hypothetical protein Taro_055465 [Colocasia esculenta]|uniref:Uncharacterized protein n=1 Tax=Colocasia esculenta TaxID=4460 RepID=A0A843XTD5_COLES|nr:hypothetical protein [Colocasia esculenta]